MSDLVKGYTDFVGEEPNGHPYEVYYADDVQEVLQGKDARIAELEKAAKAVCDYDWSDNDDDAVRAIEKLRPSYRTAYLGENSDE